MLTKVKQKIVNFDWGWLFRELSVLFMGCVLIAAEIAGLYFVVGIFYPNAALNLACLIFIFIHILLAFII